MGQEWAGPEHIWAGTIFRDSILKNHEIDYNMKIHDFVLKNKQTHTQKQKNQKHMNFGGGLMPRSLI